MSAHIDSTHAAPDAAFLSEKAQQLWGTLGVGSIHGLNPTPVQYNAIQKWVIARNRLGIPALSLKKVCTASTREPSSLPIGLAAYRDHRRRTPATTSPSED